MRRIVTIMAAGICLMAALYGCAGRKENTQETSQVKTESSKGNSC